MKTSNKLLLILLIIVFTVPLLLATTLANKIKKGEYTVERNDKKKNSKYFRSGSFAAYKVVKVVSPHPDLLKCHLKFSDKMTYEYFKSESKDSVSVYAAKDTLYVNYLATKSNVKKDIRDDHAYFNVNLLLPAFDNLVVDGAVVILDTLPTGSSLSVTLKNHGAVEDGSRKREQPGASATQAKPEKANGTAPIPKTTTTGDAGVAAEKQHFTTAQSELPESSTHNIKDALIYNIFDRM